jgi:AcrR family transcriptional regulator
VASATQPDEGPVPRRGRRRDPSIDRRVAETVIELYARAGWNGLTVDEVARRARVGKAALYLRWPTKEALLVDAVAAVGVPVVPEPSGSIRIDLLELARSLFGLYSTTNGIAYLRLYVEARYLPSLEQTWQQRTTVPRQLEARALVRQAIARGELPAGTSPTILLDALAGAMANHVLSTPPELYAEMIAQAPSYLERLVDFVLAGARAAAPPGAGSGAAAVPD